MPTLPQINAAQIVLDAQVAPYQGKLSENSIADLNTFLRKYLYDTKRSGGYTQIAVRLANAEGRKAAQLQAVLQNVSDVGSKVAKLQGEIDYSTQENINNELEFALFIMYMPVAQMTLGSKESDMAAFIRSGGYHSYPATNATEYQRTRSE